MHVTKNRSGTFSDACNVLMELERVHVEAQSLGIYSEISLRDCENTCDAGNITHRLIGVIGVNLWPQYRNYGQEEEF